jgi:hypothetical protein
MADKPGVSAASMTSIAGKSISLSISRELETLDQLQGDDLPLEIVLRLYPNVAAFNCGVMALIACGDVRLLTNDDVEVPFWYCRQLFEDGTMTQDWESLKLSITPQGARRIG